MYERTEIFLKSKVGIKSGTQCWQSHIKVLAFFFLVGLINIDIATGQEIFGLVLDNSTHKPIDYVNIGIVGKNLGTVSDNEGNYKLFIDNDFSGDSILYSRIGYLPCYIKVDELRNDENKNIFLEAADYSLDEIVIKPKQFKEQVLGVKSNSKSINAGFGDNLLGYECGVIMKSKKTSVIKQVNINVSICTYDTIFYRLNIYEVTDKMDFQNVLREPIYITLPKESVQEEFQIDLRSKNIVVDGDFLVTLEHVKDLGEGKLLFCAGLSKKTYYRKTSQGDWDTAPVGVSISIIADVEK